MSQSRPSATAMAAAIALAAHAPSLQRAQPWHWRITDGSLDLFADASRRIPTTDLLGRILLLSCGATLHHLSVAMVAAGWQPDVQRLPEPLRPGLLASLTFVRVDSRQGDDELAAAITARQTDRRPMEAREVSASDREQLVAVAAEQGSTAYIVDERAAGSVSLVLTTSSNEAVAHLRTGEALSAVVLEATRRGLATVITDAQVGQQSRVAWPAGHLLTTQVVLVSVGWPSSADPLPERPQRKPVVSAAA